MKILFLFYFVALFSFPEIRANETLIQQSDSAQTAFEYLEKNSFSKSRPWLKILHFERTRLGFLRSQADTAEFFNDPEGHKDASKELLATLKLFYSKSEKRCLYPARFLLLSQNYQPLLKFNFLEGCSRFQEFKTQLRAESATLVFSSYYLNSPASAFGHTFLRLNKGLHKGELRPELLDTGINYAAIPSTDNPILYPLFGLIGLFRGEYSRLPYYFKVREYGDFESRDLWEYNLSLTAQEIELLVAHIWELGHTFFYYYYLTENCSYHMLTLLEAAAPRLKLTDHLPFWIIPSDTVRVLFLNDNFVQSVDYRPSLRSQFFSRLSKMSDPEKDLVKPLAVLDADRTSLLQSHTVDRQIQILEASNEYLEFKNPALLETGKIPKVEAIKHQILSHRAKLGVGEKINVALPKEGPPQSSHKSLRSGLRYQSLHQTYFLDHRFALHDSLDPMAGFAPHSTLEFAKLSLKYEKEFKKFALDSFYMVSVETLTPLSRFVKKPSWKVRIGADREALRPCESCLATGLLSHAGYALNLNSSESLVFSLSGIFDFSLSGKFKNNFNLSLGPKVSLLYNSHSPLTFEVSSYFYYHLFLQDRSVQSSSFEAGLALSKSAQARIKYEKRGRQDLWTGAFYLYY